uniref:EF-hand domain-containing protein n=1 Tax=Alexandrium andersonii TaxID=327968 RepID=A0A7S2BI91_9DINO|mmetsp:Transcript_26247/g.59718  ORF Transcript_26247/g.59718 Transcript_26247/m.59718 type:complete len:268 (+) Transcript_26247:3-806(+)
MFVFGIIFSNAVAGYFDDLDLASATQVRYANDMNKYFGNLYETMVSLLCSITGGQDWMVYGSQLRHLELGNVYFAVFYFYIIFCLVGMLNVVTGIFVDSAVCTRTEDEVVECFTEDQRRTSEEVRRIFKEADVDNSGSLSFEELSRHLENPWVKAYFSGLDIDPSEAGIIFSLMDTSGNNSISIDEFVDGTMKLKGHAKSIDVLSIMFDTVRFANKFDQLCHYIEDELGAIRQVVAPELGSEPRRSALQTLESPIPLAAWNKIARMR